MVRRANSYKGMLEIVGNEETMDSQYRVDVLQNSLLSNDEAILAENWIFRHKNGAVYTSNATKTFLEANEIDVLDWPAKSLD